MECSIGSGSGPKDRVAERRSGRRTARETAPDGSKGNAASGGDFRTAIGAAGPVGWAVLGLGITAALLMFVTEFSTILSVEVGIGDCGDLAQERRDDCVSTGGEQHSYALVLFGLLALVMAFGAGVGGSRPAAAALIVVGIAVLGIALAVDLPDTNEAGQIGENFTDAKAEPRAGFYIEILAGLLAVAAGALRLTGRYVGPTPGGRRDPGPAGIR